MQRSFGLGLAGQSQVSLLYQIHVDRSNGWELLTIDTTAGYTDTHPLPTTPQKWTYKAIYRLSDARVGQWSNENSITVGG